MQEYSLRRDSKSNSADDESLPPHIKRFRMAFLTIKRITEEDRQIIFETRCGGLVTAWISKLHYCNIHTIDVLLSDQISYAAILYRRTQIRNHLLCFLQYNGKW